jgi:hypothetical protein
MLCIFFSRWLNQMQRNFIKASRKEKRLDVNRVVDIDSDCDELDKHVQHIHNGVKLEVL